MPTPLTKSISREVRLDDGRTLVVQLAPDGVYVREKGKRRAQKVPYAHLANAAEATQPMSIEVELVTERATAIATLTREAVQYRIKGTQQTELLPHGQAFSRAQLLRHGLSVHRERRATTVKRGMHF